MIGHVDGVQSVEKAFTMPELMADEGGRSAVRALG
jgi:hypothetical protein